MQPKVVYWNNAPAPYMVGRFNALADRGNLDFEAWFSAELEDEPNCKRSWEVDPARWRFQARYIPERRVFGKPLRLPLRELRATRPDLLITLYYQPEFALGSLAAHAVARRTAYRVLPVYAAWSEFAWWRELSKHLLFRAVDGAEVPGPAGAALGQRYGLPTARSQPVRQSINVAHYRQALLLDPAERDRRRRALGLAGCVFVYVGRLWSGKGLDYLFEAFKRVQAIQPDVSLLLIGDGSEEARYRTLASQLERVVFGGFVQPDDLPDYYALADALVFPTLGDPHGLVVEEAMAAGLPVICTTAAGDIERRLPEGRAGFIVPPADAETLAQRMLALANDPLLRARFAAEAQRLVADAGHTQWAIGFERLVERLLALPPRRNLAAFAARLAGGAMLRLDALRDQAPAPYVRVAQSNG